MTDTDVETELKIPVADLAPIRSILADLGARQLSENQREVNLLYDTADGDLTARGCVLRLRRYGARFVLTFKGPASYRGPIKIRSEHELEIGSLEAMSAIFEALGFSVVARYEKDRETWSFEGTEVVLDHTPMGDFVEVEGPSERIGRAARTLGLDADLAVRGSYMSLWRDYRERSPEKGLSADMVFDR